MAAKRINLINSLFKNNHGKVVIRQTPNMPLWGWVVFSALARVFSLGYAHNGFHSLANISLFVWAYLEIRSGESLFRRILGAMIMIGLLYEFFNV